MTSATSAAQAALSLLQAKKGLASDPPGHAVANLRASQNPYAVIAVDESLDSSLAPLLRMSAGHLVRIFP